MAKVQCVAVLAVLVLVCTSLALAKVNAARSLASILFVAQRYEPASSARSNTPAGSPIDAPGPASGLRGYQPSSAPSHIPAWTPSFAHHPAPYMRGYAPSFAPSYVPAGAPHLDSVMSGPLASPASAPTTFESPLASPKLLSGM